MKLIGVIRANLKRSVLDFFFGLFTFHCALHIYKVCQMKECGNSDPKFNNNKQDKYGNNSGRNSNIARISKT